MKITAVPQLPEGAPVGVRTLTAPNQPSNQSAIIESAQPKPAEVTPAKPEEQISSKYAELAKREKILRNKIQVREQELKNREAALAAKEAEYASSYVPKQKIREMFQKDPTQAMREFEISGDQLTQGLLNQPSPQDLKIQQLEAQIESLKSATDQTKKMWEERDNEGVQQALKQIKFDVKQMASQSPDQWEAILKMGDSAFDEVVERYYEAFKKTGELADLEVIAKQVEDETAEAFFNFSQLKKIQSRIKPAEVKAAVPQSKSAPKTLTHSQTSAPSKPMTARERAIAILEGKQT